MADMIYTDSETIYTDSTTTINNASWAVWCRDMSLAEDPSSWYVWNGATSSSTSFSEVWRVWHSTNTATWDVPATAPRLCRETNRRLTADEIRETEVREHTRHVEMQKRSAEREIVLQEAQRKAWSLLKSNLSPEQTLELDSKEHFHLHVAGERYRIQKGSHGNVQLLNPDGTVKRQFCIQPADVPVGDIMLAQKLLLESNVREFYRIANVTEIDERRVARHVLSPAGLALLS